MSLYYQIQDLLGHLTIPLLLCSLITVGLLIEKFIILSIKSLNKKTILYNAPRLSGKYHQNLVTRGLNLLIIHSKETKALREEVAAIWLNGQRNKLSSGIRILQVIALITPLMGLLGTVVGLIQVFNSLSDHQGPIEPALLADGLGLAMYTTAAGLIIAMPALAGAHGYQIWIDKIIHRAEQSMNQMNLLMDGIDIGKTHDQ